MTTMTATDTRTDFIAGLRALADVYDQHPELEIPSCPELTWVTSWTDDPKGDTRKIIRAIGGKWDKQEAGTDGSIMKFHSRIGALPVEILCNREQVCRRVVTGTREVTKTVPTATEEVTVTEDIIEWQCEPLLAEATA